MDHPRGCGEQMSKPAARPVMPGPSPRVRGAAAEPHHALPPHGTIPAGAGSRSLTSPMVLSTGDHPRGCGEQHVLSGTVMSAGGPSPRVRGAGVAAGSSWRARGTIPAGAGSSKTAPGLATGSRDHPRGCGEQLRPTGEDVGHGGPSPRVRGAEGHAARCRHERGTIPAGAGSRPNVTPTRGARRDHPRGCGEQTGRPAVLLSRGRGFGDFCRSRQIGHVVPFGLAGASR